MKTSQLGKIGPHGRFRSNVIKGSVPTDSRRGKSVHWEYKALVNCIGKDEEFGALDTSSEALYQKYQSQYLNYDPNID